MEYEVHIKQIANGWTLEVYGTHDNSRDIPPAFYKEEMAAVEAAVNWLKDGTTPGGDE